MAKGLLRPAKFAKMKSCSIENGTGGKRSHGCLPFPRIFYFCPAFLARGANAQVAESGRRAWLRAMWSLRPCGFESHPGHIPCHYSSFWRWVWGFFGSKSRRQGISNPKSQFKIPNPKGMPDSGL